MRKSVAWSFGITVLAIEGLAGPALALEPHDAEVWYTPRLETAPDDVPPAKPAKAAITLPPCATPLSDTPTCHLEERSHGGLVTGGAEFYSASRTPCLSGSASRSRISRAAAGVR
jgi:hypothetical protein